MKLLAARLTPLRTDMKLSLPAVQIILKVDPNLVNHVANDGSTVLHLHQENPTQLLLLKLDNIGKY
jgi:hypothetical protein